jgi:carbon monoxide dehydrogenase subunit G
MLISGESRLPAPVDTVWRALHDVDVLRVTVPGCQELTQTSPETFIGAATVGIAVIKGLYKGTLKLLEESAPDFARVAVRAKSGHAEISGEGELSLEPSNGGTLLRYKGEARINGPLAVVGQRLLPAASKSLTDQFFRNVEQYLNTAHTPQSG